MLIPHTSPPCGIKNRLFSGVSAILRKYIQTVRKKSLTEVYFSCFLCADMVQ